MGRAEMEGLLERPISSDTLRIRIDPALLHPSVPYHISYDTEKIGEFLREYGMNPKKISHRTLEFKKDVGSSLLGYVKGRKIILACDNIWENWFEDRNEGHPTRIFHHEAKHAIEDSQFMPFPSDIPLKTLHAGLGIVAFPFIHAAKRSDPASLETMLTGLITAVDVWGSALLGDVFNFTDRLPWEKRATEFEEKVAEDPRWQNLITFRPKSQFSAR